MRALLCGLWVLAVAHDVYSQHPLPAELVVSEVHETFAGLSAEITSIDPDGSWRRQKEVNEVKQSPYCSGKLTSDQLRRVGEVLSSQRAAELPNRLGDGPMNSTRVELRLGSAVSTLTLAPSQRIESLQPPADPELAARGRFIAVVKTVRECTPCPGNTLADEAGTLPGVITLRESQEGFVGESGLTIIIQPSGEWKAARFVNDKTIGTELTGRLSTEQITVLATAVRENKIESLPATLAHDAAGTVNRSLAVLQVNSKKVTAVLPSGETIRSLPAVDTPQQADEWERFKEVAKAVRAVTKEPT